MQGIKHASLISPIFLFVYIYVILLYACLGLGHLHNHIDVNYDKVCFNFFYKYVLYPYGDQKKPAKNYWQGFERALELH